MYFKHNGMSCTKSIKQYVDGLLYNHILKNVIVISVRRFYPVWVIHSSTPLPTHLRFSCS